MPAQNTLCLGQLSESSNAQENTMNATITAQAEKVAAELVTYFTQAAAENPAATHEENVTTAMTMWYSDSIKMAGLAQDEQFADMVYRLTV
jgi:hypothetical protein